MKKLVFTLICLLPIFTSQAKIITVDDNGPADFDNIQQAINSSEHGDTIIVKPGTYNQGIFFNNKSVTLTSEDPDDPNIVQSTIITTNSGYSVTFDFGEGNRSVLTGFAITGGGIHCSDGTSPTISKNVIRDCGGDGIHGEEDNAEPILSDNTISSNTGYGIYKCNGPITNNIISENNIGGIAYCDGDISNNIISENLFLSNSPGGGGLSYCKGKIVGNIIAYNHTNQKGGACYECTGDIIGNRIIGNTSQIAGGALSNCRGMIRNNIIAGNRSTNGGGLFSCYQIYNNTIVGNIAEENGGALSQCPGNISNNIIAFNSARKFVGGINGAGTSSYNNFWLNEGGNFGGGATMGPGDMIAEPLFVINGYWDNNETPDESDDFWVDGDYHVTSQAGRWSPGDQSWINDSLTSPCIDAGGEPNDSNSDWTAELWPHGRRINIGAYGGTVQASMSLSDAGNIADLNPDVNDTNDWVDYNDMLLLADKWLSNEVTLAEDLDRNGVVDFKDYAILVNNWQPKIFPPQPDPMTWQTEPYATSRTAIEMAATIATSTDDGGVEYYFECISLGGHDSGWQDEPDYTDTGLTAGTEYSYIVKARNTANLLETDYSDLRSATTFPEDTTPPGPDPATWKTEPYVSSAGSIRMVATTASDESGVEYFFTCTSNPAYSSNWQDDPVYRVTSLPMGTYSFVVRVRDKSPNRNTTGDSVEVTVDLQPPTPDPMRWAPGGEPLEVYGGGGTWDYYAEMTATEATDPSGGVEYYFECTTESGFSSGWQSSHTYKVIIGRSGQAQRFRVKARDIYGNQTAPSPVLPAI
ncbi:MAG: right-handed parallel beta-helix repeat-containing protein [Sedimentisphaerales bacterium]